MIKRINILIFVIIISIFSSQIILSQVAHLPGIGFSYFLSYSALRRVRYSPTPQQLVEGLEPPGVESRIPHSIIFDSGGTTTRLSVYSPDGKLLEISRFPTPNFITHPNATPEQLQALLLQQMISAIGQLQQKYSNLRLDNVGIAFAGPVNSKGVILHAPVTWGDKSFALKEELEKRLDVNSIVINDITAAAMRYGFNPDYQRYRRIGIITVSSGIGSKIFDTKYKETLLDDDGLAGEIGHVKVDSSPDAPACGNDPEHQGHLGAIASGRGAEFYAKELAKENPPLFQSSSMYRLSGSGAEKITTYHITEAAKANDSFALAVLDKVTAPLAQVISIIATATGVDKFVMIGGFALGVGEPYIKLLRNNLVKVGVFGKTEAQIENLVELGINDDNSGLIGAGIVAQKNYLDKVRIKEVKDDLGNPAFEVATPREINYKVISVDGVFNPANNTLANYLRGRKILVAISETVNAIYGEKIKHYFTSQEIEHAIIVLKGGEQDKTVESVLDVVRQADANGMDRRTIFVAIGGGIPMDIVGFAARIYRRGVPYIRIPTTLLGIVDAGVGIKVGVNFLGHKNFVGAFYPPLVTLNDLGFLNTLEQREIRDGLSETIKMAVIKDAKLFELVGKRYPQILSRNFATPESQLIIKLTIKAMLEELQPNLFEENLRRTPDFGHEFGHLIESISKYALSHGEAVAIGMAMSSYIAYKYSKLDKNSLDRIIGLIKRVGLPIYTDLASPRLIWERLPEIIEGKGGALHLVIPVSVGNADFIESITYEDITEAVSYLKGFR